MKYAIYKSPFLEFTTPFTAYEALKMVVLLPLLPFRLIIGLLALVVASAIGYAASRGYDLSEPLPEHRRRIAFYIRYPIRVMLAMLGFWHIEVVGWENMELAKRVRPIGIFNHISWLDPFILTALFAPSGVAADYVGKLPVLKYGQLAFHHIFVPKTNRLKQTDGQQRQVHLAETIATRARDPRYMQAWPHGGWPLLVVPPEGTTTNGRCLLEFRSGAFVASRPVMPILLEFPFKGVNPAWPHASLSADLWHIMRMLSQFRNSLRITIMPPHEPTKAEAADPKLYARNMRDLMAARLGVPKVDGQNYIDKTAIRRAGIRVNWLGTGLVAPKGAVDGDGFVELDVPPPSERS